MTNVKPRQGRPALPTILLGSKGYFIDLEARLFRETMDPGRYIDFDSAKGSQLRGQAGIVTCLRCGASVMISAALQRARLRCVRCGMILEHPDPSRCQLMSSGSEVMQMKTDQIRKQVDDALEELGRQLEQGASEQMLAYLSAMARFHNYSWGNIILISLQRNNASRVAGYQTWRKLGRQVKKGEHGIAIMAPIVRRKQMDDDRTVEEVFAFKTAYVFDISQTEGKPLPEATQARGNPGEWITRLKTFLAGQGIQLVHLGSMSRAEGASFGGAIAVRRGLSAAEEFSVLCHEAAHELLHRADQGTENSKTVRETEAEAVAFVVCQAVGLDTNSASSDYLSLYGGNKEVLAKSLARIQRTVARIIAGLMTEEKPAVMLGEAAVLPCREAA